MKHYKKIFIATLLTAVASSANAIETTIDFEDQSVISFINSIPSLTIGGVTFSADQGLAISSSLSITEPDFSGNFLANSAFGGFTDLKIDFSTPVDMFSFNFGDNQNDWELIAFNTEGVAIDSLMINAIPVSASNNGEFFGLASDLGISFAQLTNKGSANLFGAVDNIEFDNLTYTTTMAVSPVPEPSTYALMLGGLGMVGFMAYRRRKATNA